MGSIQGVRSTSRPLAYVLESPPALLRELIALRQCYTKRRISLSWTDFHGAFRNSSIDPNHAQYFGYVFCQFKAVKLRLTSGWTLSPAYWGVPAETALIRMLREYYRIMSHVRAEWRNEIGIPAPIPANVSVGPAVSNWKNNTFFAVPFVDNVALIHV